MESDEDYNSDNLEFLNDNHDTICDEEEVSEGNEEESDEEYGNGYSHEPTIAEIESRGYKYARKAETVATPDQDTDPGSEPIPSGRAGNTDWCLCGHCQAMPTDI